MGMLITSYLVLVNISNSIMLTMHGTNSFTALDFWLLFCKVVVCLALIEYAVLLSIKPYLESRQHKLRGNGRKKTVRRIAGFFPADSDEFCHYVDSRMLIVSLTVVIIFCIGYFTHFMNVLNNPPKFKPTSFDGII